MVWIFEVDCCCWFIVWWGWGLWDRLLLLCGCLLILFVWCVVLCWLFCGVSLLWMCWVVWVDSCSFVWLDVGIVFVWLVVCCGRLCMCCLLFIVCFLCVVVYLVWNSGCLVVFVLCNSWLDGWFWFCLLLLWVGLLLGLCVVCL